MMTSRTILPTRDDNCAGTLRMQSMILEAAHLMQERVHYLLFVCLFNDAVLPTLSYETFELERHGVSNCGFIILFYERIVSILRFCSGIFRKYRRNITINYHESESDGRSSKRAPL